MLKSSNFIKSLLFFWAALGLMHSSYFMTLASSFIMGKASYFIQALLFEAVSPIIFIIILDGRLELTNK